KGITFVDDSKATNVDAVVRAVESIPQSIILIAGGVDKGGSYAPWKAAFAERVRLVCTIGQAATKIQQEVGSIVPTYHFVSLRDAVSYAAKHAVAQEVVLLSPGCSSYDMFSSYVHRGECFKAIVHDLVTDLLGN
ncbi:MAG: glutamate ligase domain-containing protein, partial [Parachlamydiaceae bacterium]